MYYSYVAISIVMIQPSYQSPSLVLLDMDIVHYLRLLTKSNLTRICILIEVSFWVVDFVKILESEATIVRRIDCDSGWFIEPQ